jgi:hypothetical protein
LKILTTAPTRAAIKVKTALTPLNELRTFLEITDWLSAIVSETAHHLFSQRGSNLHICSLIEHMEEIFVSEDDRLFIIAHLIIKRMSRWDTHKHETVNFFPINEKGAISFCDVKQVIEIFFVSLHYRGVSLS